MILLDTNVLSELMRNEPDPGVLSWTTSFNGPELGTTSLTIAELFFGIALLEDGRRKVGLNTAMSGLIESLEERVYPFDLKAANVYGPLVADRQHAGRPMSYADAQIASISLSIGATLATRNIKDFEGCGIDLHNPFQPV